MAVSLARRIRRIGLLPQLSIEELMDDNMRSKLANAKARLEAATDPAIISAERQRHDEIWAAIKQEVSPLRQRRLELEPADRIKQVADLRGQAKAHRIAMKRLNKGKNPVKKAA